MNMRQFIESQRIRVEVVYGTNGPILEEFKNSYPWTVTLKRKGRQMTVPFYTGVSLGEPDAAIVLDCLASDAAGYENARSFDDWCDEYGYDKDSRKAERIFKAVEAYAKKLQRFMGEDYFKLLWEVDRL